MITRRFGFPRLYGAQKPYRDVRAGLIRVKLVNGIPHTWAVARPGGVHLGEGAPHYLNVLPQNSGTANQIVRTPTPQLNMLRPHLAMDPSDSATWQREYRF